jgi:hypothetical protein
LLLGDIKKGGREMEVKHPDLSPLLRKWEYDQDNNSIRMISSKEGEPLYFHERIHMGIKQIQANGRPDGARPGCCESLLELLQKGVKSQETPGRVFLDDNESSKLYEEIEQYANRVDLYRRFENFSGLASDLRHCWNTLDFVNDRCALQQNNRKKFLNLRPYLWKTAALALAEREARSNNYNAAIGYLNMAIMKLKGADCDNEREALRFLKELEETRQDYNEKIGKLPEYSEGGDYDWESPQEKIERGIFERL